MCATSSPRRTVSFLFENRTEPWLSTDQPILCRASLSSSFRFAFSIPHSLFPSFPDFWGNTVYHGTSPDDAVTSKASGYPQSNKRFHRYARQEQLGVPR